MTEHSLPLPLPYRFISIQGEDAERFLQGQLSCDVALIDAEHIQYATANTPKGRMIALMRITRWKQGFLCCLHASQYEGAFAHLSKYKVFFKCEMDEAPLCAYGLMDPKDETRIPQTTNAIDAADDSSLYVRKPGTPARIEWWTDTVPPEINTDENDLEHWFAEDCRCGIPEIYQSTQDRFILQHLNLQELGAVSFSKGCYTGQEIIARMKYLGKLKKKTFLLQGQSHTDALPGSGVFDAQGKKCGEVVRYHCDQQGQIQCGIALAVLDMQFDSSDEAVYLNEDRSCAFKVTALDYSDTP